MFKRLVLCSLVPALLFAKSYRYPSITTEVRLMPNGDARVLQERTYRFDGSFSWAFVDLDKRGAADVRFHRIRELSAAGWREIEPLEVTDRAKSLYVRWGYEAVDEEKTFELDYTVVGAVRRYRDVAEFFWKIVEDEHEPVEEVLIELALPGSSPNRFKVYVHSRARPGEMDFGPDMANVHIRQVGIPKDAFVEVRALISPEIFPGAELIDKDAYARILGEEKRNYLLSGLRDYILLPLGLLIGLLLPVVLLLFFYFRHGREPDINYDAVYEREPPRKAPPLAVPAIMSQRQQSSSRNAEVFRGLYASLLDLAQQGYVSIEESGSGSKRFYIFRLERPEQTAELEPFGQEVVRFLFGEVAQGTGSFTSKEMQKYTIAHASQIRTRLGRWYDGTRSWWEDQLDGGLLEPDSIQARRNYLAWVLPSIALGAILIGFGMQVLLGMPGGFSWVVSVNLGILLLVVFASLGRPILRWSTAAYLEHRRWKTFRKFLVEFSAIEQAPIQLLPIWEQYYVYAVALGVAKEFLDNVGRLAAAQNRSVPVPVWFVPAGSGGERLESVGQSLQGLSNLSSNFTSMASSFSPKSSSGGGFSGGGGGGGGGGSSGAG